MKRRRGRVSCYRGLKGNFPAEELSLFSLCSHIFTTFCVELTHLFNDADEVDGAALFDVVLSVAQDKSFRDSDDEMNVVRRHASPCRYLK